MPVIGELSELPNVVPHLLIGGVEQVRPVFVDFDSGLRLGFGIGVATEVRATVEDENTLPELGTSWVAARSAMVRPKNPEPTTKRSKRSVIGCLGYLTLPPKPDLAGRGPPAFTQVSIRGA
jgi:hypothetical protein